MKSKIAAIVLVCCMMLAGCASPVEKGAELLQKEEYQEAQKQFQKSVDREKELAEAYRGLGICYYEQKDYKKAQESLEKALENGVEETVSFYHLLGHCAWQNQQVEQAAVYLEKGQQLPGGEEAMLQEMALNEILCYEKLEQYEIALEKLEIYVGNYPEDEDAAKELEFLHTQAPEGKDR